MQDPPNVSGNQMYSSAGGFNILQAGQMPMMQDLILTRWENLYTHFSNIWLSYPDSFYEKGVDNQQWEFGTYF